MSIGTVHHFETEVANEVGVAAACLAYNIRYWCAHKFANGKDIEDGLPWVYNSMEAWDEQISYLSKKQIRTALKALEDAGIIATKIRNKSAYNRTKSYTYLWHDWSGNDETEAQDVPFAPEGKSERPDGQMTNAPEGKSKCPEGPKNRTIKYTYEIPSNTASAPSPDGGAERAAINEPFPSPSPNLNRQLPAVPKLAGEVMSPVEIAAKKEIEKMKILGTVAALPGGKGSG